MDEAIAPREAIGTRTGVAVLGGHRVSDTEESTMARIPPDVPELVDQGRSRPEPPKLQPSNPPAPTPGRSLVLSRAGVAG
jgi:hypothetical protein